MKLALSKLFLLMGSAVLTGGGLTSCATISQDECAIQNMEDVGFKHGRAGKSRGRFAKLSKSCAKHDIFIDRAAYMRGFDKGLPLFCNYDNGFSHGTSGRRVYDECRAIQADDYVRGHQDGYAVYEIKRGHQNLIAQYDESVADLAYIRRSLEEDELNAKERKRLLKKEIRLEDEREEIRYEIREYERLYDLPRYDFAY